MFDPPYFDLSKTKQVLGIAGWGAHDPGTPLVARPHTLKQELAQKFGNYPSQKWVYGCPCYSAARCQQMGDALVKAVEVRGSAAKWLLSEKFPDWDLFFVVTGELHSAIEGLWHGIDPQHPMHNHSSTKNAAEALLKIHQAVDRMLGELMDAATDADVIAFAMGGMGSNQSDIQSMVLLPELLYRHTFKQSLLKVRPEWAAAPQQIPQLTEIEKWQGSGVDWSTKNLLDSEKNLSLIDRLRKLKQEKLPPKLQAIINPLYQGSKKIMSSKQQHSEQLDGNSPTSKSALHLSLNWQPSMAYQPYWSQMPAFALPSFYDGRVRINLIGRESKGIVELSEYEEICTQLEAMIRACRDVCTGQPVVTNVERPDIQNPLSLDSSDADMTIVWNGISNAFVHPEYGLIGPIPFRRTGGHTGPYGVAFVASSDIEPGLRGIRSSFDVIPTIADLLGVSINVPHSGKSFFQQSLSS